MGNSATAVTFEASLRRPASPKNATWLFLLLPKMLAKSREFQLARKTAVDEAA